MTVVEVVVCVSHGVDNGLSAHERHELILADDERVLAVAFIYEGKDPQVIDMPSS